MFKAKVTAFCPSADYKVAVCAQSYIGKKGYTIPKKVLHADDLAFLYQDLHMVPVQQGPQYGAANQDTTTAFAVWRENANKLYVPRFYGIARYGYPSRIDEELALRSTVAPISCVFDKPLRDYQEVVVGTYLSHVQGGPGGEGPLSKGGIITIKCGAGKTVMAIKIISKLAVKTLIIVHKEFLLNQWVERIHEFLPTARIGRIQGNVFDSEGKDIVIGMLQTLYDREFPAGAFDDFGLTVVDEVHRIGSCQFSRALLRIQTPYMLGVTATLERKDGLTKVIHHFIGPTVYADTQGLQSDDGSVLVRAMEFVSHDSEFNHVVTDYRGNTQISTMITKLCQHGPRTRCLVDILRHTVTETPDAQILVLAHNRSLLVDLHKAVVGLDIATAGFYLGGMKTEELERTTQQQVILATYAMAAEGFDHKNLSVLVLATPKTDIVQSVGRIFRQKHVRPLIVDVVDGHDSFKKQWTRRRAYYKKCGFRIQYGLSTKPDQWKTVYEPPVGSAASANASSEANANTGQRAESDDGEEDSDEGTGTGTGTVGKGKGKGDGGGKSSSRCLISISDLQK